MLWRELRDMIHDSQAVTIRFTDMIEKLDCDDSPDKNMIAKIINIEEDTDDDQTLHLVFDISGYEDHNRSVAAHNWIDEDGKPTLTWFETEWYPKDGICNVYVDGNLDSEIDLFDILTGCSCCHGDEALYYENDMNNAFIDSSGEMLVMADGNSIKFKVDRCPRCGFLFCSSSNKHTC